MTRTLAALAALSLSLAIALGAVGAHAIGGDPAARELWRTASFWHTANSLGLLALAVLWPHLGRRLGLAGVLAVGLGTLAFCGSIYIQALQGSAPVPMLAPIGGSLQILGWLAVALAAVTGRTRSAEG
ncbi:DUF423 domain-containing protein [Thalassobaculum sp. OXR-137]|uniref:DUF423 domain-containing protein n=1 Tax=Thalassobaculum sp. OXR-137 TaxID=3100173 RepID=UPI002AC925F5|nr:DUF423 domain-containing protein [Thalassobaculum sp. OXR-137]WPZ37015.1 DUF423 domain-containing protein [Thalassobaculum sp. OXR-137]